MPCGWEGEHCQEEYLEGEILRLEGQIRFLSEIVMKKGSLEEVNYVREIRYLKPLKRLPKGNAPA